ncbi:MAG: GxxExxY protein [Anaerolineales bacterium]
MPGRYFPRKSLSQYPPIPAEVEKVGQSVLNAAFHVHTVLGPGLLESVYQAALARELMKRKINFYEQYPCPVEYDGVLLNVAFRVDFLVERVVVVEIKSVEVVQSVHFAQTLNYLRLMNLRLGFLLNFNTEHLKDGIERIVN